MNPMAPARKINSIMRKEGPSLSVAESCTGGLVSKLLTDVPGSSEFFSGGVVSYSNEVKARVLGVTPATLEDHGAVSPETAREMAEGILALMGTDLSVAITGIAGPSGGSAAKPVGLVYIAVAGKNRETGVKKFRFSGSREEIRESSAAAALEMLLTLLK